MRMLCAPRLFFHNQNYFQMKFYMFLKGNYSIVKLLQRRPFIPHCQGVVCLPYAYIWTHIHILKAWKIIQEYYYGIVKNSVLTITSGKYL